MSLDELLKKELGEAFQCVGTWWIPNSQDDESPPSFSGTLTFFLGEPIRLNVIGRLEKNPSGLVDMIWGVSDEGEFITLFQCQQIGEVIGAVLRESYIVQGVFVSARGWLLPGVNIAFKSLTLHYTHLGEWVGISGLTGSKIEDYVKEKKAWISYEEPQKLPPVTVSAYNISIGFAATWNSVGARTREASITQSTSIKIEEQDSKWISLRHAHALVGGIQNFLSLLTYDDPIYPTVVEGSARVIESSTGAGLDTTVRLLYARRGTIKSSKDLSSHKMLFTYNDVADVLESGLNKLIVLEEDELKPMLNEFFADYFSPSAYLQDRFMATVRVIESFHRRTSENYYMPEEEYLKGLFKTFMEPVQDARRQCKISDSFRDRLKSQLRYGSEYALRKRLNDLFALHGEKFLTLFVDEEQRTFVNHVVDTRNWFTHFDEKLKHKAIRGGKELSYLNLRLQLFTVALLLRYIGLPQADIEAQFRHWKFDYLKPQPENIQ